MTKEISKKQLLSELILRWKNGEEPRSFFTLIRYYAISVNPSLSEYGYSSRLSPEEWDKLIISRIDMTYTKIKTEFQEMIFTTLKSKYERARAQIPRRMTNTMIDKDIAERGCFYEVKDRLYILLHHWDILDEAKALIEDQKMHLGKFVSDKQNVHTRVVNRQTNTILGELAKVEVKKKQRTLDEIMICWQEKYSHTEIGPVFKDMTYWGNKSEIEEENDWAYRNALRSLWAKIKTYPTELRIELEKRLFEECSDSVGKCAQGHITRLANVMVGFDESITHKESKSETFQDKMAAISILEIDDSEKIVQAKKVMDEMNIPENERSAWLDAF